MVVIPRSTFFPKHPSRLESTLTPHVTFNLHLCHGRTLCHRWDRSHLHSINGGHQNKKIELATCTVRRRGYQTWIVGLKVRALSVYFTADGREGIKLENKRKQAKKPTRLTIQQKRTVVVPRVNYDERLHNYNCNSKNLRNPRNPARYYGTSEDSRASHQSPKKNCSRLTKRDTPRAHSHKTEKQSATASAQTLVFPNARRGV